MTLQLSASVATENWSPLDRMVNSHLSSFGMPLPLRLKARKECQKDADLSQLSHSHQVANISQLQMPLRKSLAIFLMSLDKNLVSLTVPST